MVHEEKTKGINIKEMEKEERNEEKETRKEKRGKGGILGRFQIGMTSTLL